MFKTRQQFDGGMKQDVLESGTHTFPILCAAAAAKLTKDAPNPFAIAVAALTFLGSVLNLYLVRSGEPTPGDCLLGYSRFDSAARFPFRPVQPVQLLCLAGGGHLYAQLYALRGADRPFTPTTSLP